MSQLHDDLTPDEVSQLDAVVGSGVRLLHRRRRRIGMVASGAVAVAVVAAIAGTAIVTAMLRAGDEPVIVGPPPSVSTAAPTPTPSPSPTTSPSSSPTAPSAPPTTITEDPADPSTWLVSDAGMGPFRLGMPFDAASVLVPGSADCSGGESSRPSVYYGYAHRLWIADGRDESGISAGLGLVAWDSWTPPPVDMSVTPRTAEGIGLGSSEADVRLAYPQAVELFHNVSYLQVGRMYFGIADGIVRSIGVTATEPPYEYCG